MCGVCARACACALCLSVVGLPRIPKKKVAGKISVPLQFDLILGGGSGFMPGARWFTYCS